MSDAAINNEQNRYIGELPLTMRSFQCDVQYFTKESIDDLSFVILSILDSDDNGQYSFDALGELLGFAIRDGEDLIGNKRYRDEQEIGLLKSILKKLENLRLLVFSDTTVKMTNLGRISINNKCIYHFHNAHMELREFSEIRSSLPLSLRMFPYAKELGILGYNRQLQSFWPDDKEVESIISSRPSQLAMRLNNLQPNFYHIFMAKQADLYDEIEVMFQFQLDYDDAEYNISFLHNNEVARNATAILNENINNDIREEVILRCRFKQLWDNREIKFTYDVLQPFIKLVDIPSLANDSRTDWCDSDVFKLIANNDQPQTWLGLSRYCPVLIIEKNIKNITEKLEWQIFSNRVDEEFLLNNFMAYPWDLEVLSSSAQLSIDCLQNLILQEKETVEDWDWSVLMNILQPSFVKKHIRLIKGNLAEYTENTKEIQDLILRYPEHLWDWNKIINEFEIEYLIDNIQNIYKHLNVSLLLDRIFAYSTGVNYAINNKTFWLTLTAIQHNGIQLSSFTANNKNYAWSVELIQKLELLGLIDWISDDSYCGLDVNPYLKWDMNLFSTFHRKLQSKQGIRHVCQQIYSSDIITQYLDFSWDWDILSSNSNLINNRDFLNAASHLLKWELVIENSDDVCCVQELPQLESILKANPAASRELSKRISIEFVSSHPLFPWDWSIMTERMFAHLKLSNLGHPSFIDLWDWEYLSNSLPVNYIYDNLQRYAKYWNWAIIIDRLVPKHKRLDPDTLSPFAEILTSVTGKQCLKGWSDWTRLYSFKELKSLILATKTRKSFWWDIDYFSLHTEFNLTSDLAACQRFINWKLLSSSGIISRQLSFNKDNNITRQRWNEIVDRLLQDPNNRWDFKALSRQDCFVSNLHFIRNYSKNIDWKYISAHSIVFAQSDTNKLYEIIENFKGYIDWYELTSRTDITFSRGIYNSFHNRNWNLNNLFTNGLLEIDSEIIQDYPNYDWNWIALSDSPNVKLNSEIIQKNISKEWDWQKLSHREDIIWSKTLCAQIWNLRCDVDWFQISSNSKLLLDSAVVTEMVEHGINLNWDIISKSKNVLNLPKSVFPNLNWGTILRMELFDVNSLQDLHKYSKFIDWHLLSGLSSFNPNIDILRQYQENIDWFALCYNPNFEINNDILDEFGDYLDWNRVSASESLSFSTELLEKYSDRWNINLLHKNRRFTNNRLSLGDFGKQDAIRSFLSRFCADTPKIYHFTHLSNAIKIIRTGKIQSRNAARGTFDNSAGNNVNRTNKAHSFARFYFTKGTPTQFYNECMGKDKDDSYYDRAYQLGLPKCPFPVFFVVELKEVLQKNKDISWYSTGNMQKDATNFFKVINCPDKIDGQGIYESRNKDARQQEFLIEKELQLESLKTLRIYCFDDEQYTLLVEAVKNSPLSNVIRVSRYPFLRENKHLSIDLTPSYIRIDAGNFQGEYKFIVDAPHEILDRADIDGKCIIPTANRVTTKGFVKVPRTKPYRILLATEFPEPKKWCLYDNSEFIYGK